MINKSIFLIITFIFHTLSLSSQIVNVDSKRQSEEKGLSGITEFTFDFNKSVQTDWEFSNITYLQWDNEKWSVLILNETNLDRAAGIDFSNDGYQHLRVSKHLNKIYTIYYIFLIYLFHHISKIQSKLYLS